MCGIIGYVGKRPAKDLLIAGLERLEFRGYDSAGIALLEDDGLEYVRAVGNLEQAQAGRRPERLATRRPALGHTRWATHGGVTEDNAHPLTGCDDGQLAIVLNGIVENYRELKAELEAGGHAFSSETDAEVVAHLLETRLRGRPRSQRCAPSTAGSRATSPSSSSTTTSPTGSSASAARRRSSSGSATARTSSPRTWRAFLAETRRVAVPGQRPGRRDHARPASASSTPPTAARSSSRRSEIDWDEEVAERERLRDVHAEGDLRAARGLPRRRSATASATATSCWTASGMTEEELRDAAPDRHRRLRHRLPRRRRRPLRDRGVGRASRSSPTSRASGSTATR